MKNSIPFSSVILQSGPVNLEKFGNLAILEKVQEFQLKPRNFDTLKKKKT